ncbi:hypothetical protein L6164_035729 [Bauhinia variegata]|uniref:Uncharacterized protein n=1 Tax=Bauhinia variegata TaxID=167791 RepID=A0ACB9KEU5_BAUVA|nr:hypothetical protein L6164_035729 [Bauhinia variegata]
MSSRSANSSSVSGRNSKRSFSNSASSNRSNNNSNSTTSNKKKKTNQKTLGMAWGSNSLSSSRSSFRNSAFSDFGSYMAVKNRKLHNQFDAEASIASFIGSSSGKPIFDGVSIFVDGFTIPSSQELRGYMLKYGGRFENYFSRRCVTHIICSNLPDSKVKNLRAFSAGLPVVKPTWILDSVAANKLLSWVPYQLDQLANNQPKLLEFFTLKNSKMSEGTLTSAFCELEPEAEDSSVRVGQLKDLQSSKVGEIVEFSRQTSSESDDNVPENTNATNMEEPSRVRGIYYEVEVAEGNNTDTKEESNVQSEREPSHHGPPASASSHCLNSQNLKEQPRSLRTESSKQSHSTLGDPNFVENYFKSSRLHFIGTWRNRYRKRYPILPGRFNSSSSNANASFISGKTIILHVDMDCFFVSVVIRNHPELLDKPVAVCHSDNPKGTSEISSANYPARGYGIRAGMFVRDARALCPHLLVVPYNFEAYEEVADQFYSILHRRCNNVQAVSCDEAFLDVTDLEGEDPVLLASSIRQEIYETTGCTASAGIAGNMLMARIATRTAKPNGQYHITPERVDDHLSQLPISALPGIGYVLEQKLKKQNVRTCGQLRMISKDSLQKDYGIKTGEMLWNYTRGIDNRLVGFIQESKSIGAEVNWGVRFKDMKDCNKFLIDLCKEVSLRLQGCGFLGRKFTLKIKKRRKYAEEPTKYMGCGDCENLSHSLTIPLATDNMDVLQRIVKQLFGYFHIDVKEIRGIGLQVSRLENLDPSKQDTEKNSLKSWLTSASANAEEESCPIDLGKQKIDGTSGQACRDSPGPSVQIDNKVLNHQAGFDLIAMLPPLYHLDVEVIKNLPPELFSELNENYGGKLVDFISKGKGISENISSFGSPLLEREAMNKEPELLSSELSPQILQENKCEPGGVEALPGSGAGQNNKVPQNSSFGKDDIMPSSLSQVDTSVLGQLPEDLKADILEQLPPHRRQESCSNAASGTLRGDNQEALGIKNYENCPGSNDSILNDNLWVGNPPNWVDKLKVSNCLILKKLSEMYYKSGLSGTFSSVLQETMSELPHLDLALHSSDDTINILCELLKQYIKVKIERDIEEIYICFRLIKRFAAKSQLFLQVYNIVYPYLQGAVDDNYEGSLLITS